MLRVCVRTHSQIKLLWPQPAKQEQYCSVKAKTTATENLPVYLKLEIQIASLSEAKLKLISSYS